MIIIRRLDHLQSIRQVAFWENSEDQARLENWTDPQALEVPLKTYKIL